MAKSSCRVCGMDTDEPLRIEYHGERADFCCFECAIKTLAPECPHCEVRVIGHGTYGDDGRTFCCSHCAVAEADLKPATQ